MLFKEKSRIKCAPFVKWAGGKARMWKYLEPYFKNIDWSKRRYVEPFVGGGAVFFNLDTSNCLINDFNGELITTYRVIQDKKKMESLIKLVEKKYSDKITTRFDKKRDSDKTEKFYIPDPDFYETQRNIDLSKLADIEIAARFLYLNKTGFNGMYRVNSKGKFNIPKGKFKIKPRIVDKSNILACHARLNGTTIKSGDYYNLKDEIRKNDIVYLDPPYVPISPTSSFTQYTKLDFNYKDQEKLKNFCDHVNKKGAKFIQNNSDHPDLRKLYNGYKIDESPEISRTIGGGANFRMTVKELIITNIKL